MPAIQRVRDLVPVRIGGHQLYFDVGTRQVGRQRDVVRDRRVGDSQTLRVRRGGQIGQVSRRAVQQAHGVDGFVGRKKEGPLAPAVAELPRQSIGALFQLERRDRPRAVCRQG